MYILVLSEHDCYTMARKGAFKNSKTIIISIRDIDKPVLGNLSLSDGVIGVLSLNFNDTLSGDGVFTSQDAVKIKHFIDSYKEKADTVVVHCFAGQSRSVGVAKALQTYFSKIEPTTLSIKASSFSPNSRVYDLLKKELRI